MQVCAKESSQPVVGETVPPAINPWLARLGLSHVLDDTTHLPCPGSISQWGSEEPGINDFFLMPEGKGFHLNRKQFNRQLKEEVVAANVEQLENTSLKALKEIESGWELQLDNPQGRLTETCQFIVDATGIKSQVARKIGVARNQFDSVISLCALYQLDTTPQKPPYTLLSDSENGWWYGTQLPNQQALISLCTDRETLLDNNLGGVENWFKELTVNHWFYQMCCDQFGQTLTYPDSVIPRVAPSSILTRVVGDNWLCAGDAGSSYDSLTSAGITKAIQQGTIAGEAIVAYLLSGETATLQDYQQMVFDDFNSYIRLHRQLHCQGTRFDQSMFWKRRLNAQFD